MTWAAFGHSFDRTRKRCSCCTGLQDIDGLVLMDD
jgi:hypothetical protein